MHLEYLTGVDHYVCNRFADDVAMIERCAASKASPRIPKTRADFKPERNVAVGLGRAKRRGRKPDWFGFTEQLLEAGAAESDIYAGLTQDLALINSCASAEARPPQAR